MTTTDHVRDTAAICSLHGWTPQQFGAARAIGHPAPLTQRVRSAIFGSPDPQIVWLYDEHQSAEWTAGLKRLTAGRATWPRTFVAEGLRCVTSDELQNRLGWTTDDVDRAIGAYRFPSGRPGLAEQGGGLLRRTRLFPGYEVDQWLDSVERVLGPVAVPLTAA